MNESNESNRGSVTLEFASLSLSLCSNRIIINHHPHPQQQQQTNSNMDGLHANDVLCGRGGATNNFIGNKRFRDLVQDHKARYLAAKKNDKQKIARQIVTIIQERGGRFLRKDDMSDAWIDIGEKKAREKTSQALREGLDVRGRTGGTRHRREHSSDSSLEGFTKRRKLITTHSVEDSPTLVSEVGDADTLPDLEEETNRIMPHFLSHAVLSSDDCDDVAQV
jgi:hypothetical protein